MQEIIIDENNEIKDVIEVEDILNKPQTLKSYSKQIFNSLDKIKELLVQSEAFINVIKASIPEISYEAILPSDIRKKLLNGSLKIMKSRKGELLATIVDNENNTIVKNIRLKKILKTPELNSAITNLNLDLKLAQIAQQVENLTLSLNDVKEGLELDRLSTAFSTKQKLLQAMSITNEPLRQNALLAVAHSAEDSRNLLMLSQKINIDQLNNQPVDTISKFLNRTTQDEIDKTMKSIKDGMSAIYEVSIAETLAYKELGEIEAAKLSLNVYSDYITNTFLTEDKDTIERLFLLDSSNDEDYWSNITSTAIEVTKEIENFNNFIENDAEDENV